MPTQTIRVTPASDARAMAPANRSAWGSTGPSPPGWPNSSWRWQCESNHSNTASPTGQSLRRGKRGAPFSTASPPG